MLAGRIGGLRCGVRFLIWQRLRVEMPVISYHPPSKGGGRSGESYLPPSRGRGMPEGQGVGRRRKRAGLSGIVILYLMRCFIPMRHTMSIASSAPAH